MTQPDRRLNCEPCGDTQRDGRGRRSRSVILEDFADLRKAGLTNELMNEVEKLFAGNDVSRRTRDARNADLGPPN